MVHTFEANCSAIWSNGRGQDLERVKFRGWAIKSEWLSPKCKQQHVDNFGFRSLAPHVQTPGEERGWYGHMYYFGTSKRWTVICWISRNLTFFWAASLKLQSYLPLGQHACNNVLLDERIPLNSSTLKEAKPHTIFSYQSNKEDIKMKQKKRDKERHCTLNTTTTRYPFSMGSLKQGTPFKTGH